MTAMQVEVTNPTGLHARPASELVVSARKFASSITIRRVDGGAAFNAKSILRLLSEGIGQGTVIEIAADGEDEGPAVEALVQLVRSGFDE